MRIPLEAQKRKSRSEAILKREKIPINPYLPVIETKRQSRRRSRDEVAWRALALLAVALKGFGRSAGEIKEIIAAFGLQKHFSPEEAAFIGNRSPSKSARRAFGWRIEAAWTLLWALGHVRKLGKPAAECNVQRAIRTIQKRTAMEFVRDSKLRPQDEILDQADLIYRYRWAIVDARLNGRPVPDGLDPDVALERHHTLNWLIGYMDQSWDEITTDT